MTNLAAGISDEPLSHQEVIDAGQAAAERCGRLLADVVQRIGLVSLDDVLRGRVHAWAEDDPDPATAQELTNLLAAAEDGDEEAVAELEDRFAGMLEFGTAGLRARSAADPNRMNRAVVLRAAAGPRRLPADGRWDPRADGRHGVRRAVQLRRLRPRHGRGCGRGRGRAAILPRPLPTPVLAFAIRTSAPTRVSW